MKLSEMNPFPDAAAMSKLPQRGQQRMAAEAFKDLERYLSLLQELDDVTDLKEVAAQAYQAFRNFGNAYYHSTGKKTHPSKLGRR